MTAPEPNYLKTFIPKEVSRQLGILPAVIVGRLICFHADEKWARYTLRTAADELGVGIDAVKSAFKKLVDHQIISKRLVYTAIGKENHYRVDMNRVNSLGVSGKSTHPTEGVSGKSTDGCVENPPTGEWKFHSYNTDHITDLITREAEHKKSDFLTSINKVKSQHEELSEFDSDRLADFIVSYLANKPRKIVDLDAFMYEVMTSWTGARRAALKPTNLKPANDRIKKKTNYDLKVAYKA